MNPIGRGKRSKKTAKGSTIPSHLAELAARLDRGNPNAYAVYFGGMSRSDQEKVAFPAAHLPSRGTVVDAGSGTGATAFHIANLYPNLRVVGLDANPKAIEHASNTYRRENLSFELGDITRPTFPAGSIAAFFNSSTLHELRGAHNDFDLEPIQKTIKAQSEQLEEGGFEIIRDFVVPAGPAVVHLDLPTEDGAANGPPSELSTAALFTRFCCDFRSSTNVDAPVRARQIPCDRPGHVRYEISLRDATEFMLRKDFRKGTDWEKELEEQYLYFSQDEFEGEFTGNGLRVLVASEIPNTWIVQNRFENRVFLSTPEGDRVEYPPTKFLIVGDRPPEGQGVLLREAAWKVSEEPAYLSLEVYRETRTRKLREVVHRPNPVADLIPWFEENGRIYVVARAGFPRPIINATNVGPNLTRASKAGFITEAIAVSRDLGSDAIAGIRAAVSERIETDDSAVHGITRSFGYFPAPGGLSEYIEAYFAKIDEAAVDEALHPPALRVFARQESKASVRFLQVRRSNFEEVDVDGTVLYSGELEFVTPRVLSRNTIATIPVIRSGEEIFVGIEHRELAAVQHVKETSSSIATAPAWRTPWEVETMPEALDFVTERFASDFGVRARRAWPIGGSYYPSAGATPELVHPLAVEIDVEGAAKSSLKWVALSKLVEHLDEIEDGHLLSLVLRLAHATDRLSPTRRIDGLARA